MLVWGGCTVSYASYNNGARYNPATDTWQPMSSTGAPAARNRQVAVWTGNQMVVWGGNASAYGAYLQSGGVYTPATDTWNVISTTTAPPARTDSSAVWTGSQMLVYGGYNGTYGNEADAYSPPPLGLPAINTQPQGETVTVGQLLSLSVSASGSPLTYQWRNTGVAIGAATNTNYVVASAQLSDAGNYDVIVSNGAGSVTSAVATVTVQLGFNDGIPDSWRVKYFGPNCSGNPQAAATADPDGDGLNNYQEYLMGTDPTNANSVRSVPVAVSTYAGSIVGGQDGSYTNATFDTPGGMVLAPDGRLWLTEIGATGNRIRIIDQSGLVTTLAGTNYAGYADGLGAAAQFNSPASIAFDHAGNAFVADLSNNRIRKVTPQGLVSTFAGSTQGYAEGVGVAAMFNQPYCVCIDTNDNLYVADFGNSRVRKITPDGTVSTFAGGANGNLNGPRLSARFNSPNALTIGVDGTFYVSDWANGQIRVINTNGVVSTLAGGLTYLESVQMRSDGALYCKVGGSAERLLKVDLTGNVVWSVNYQVGMKDGAIDFAKFGQFVNPPLIITNGFNLPAGSLLLPDLFNNRLRAVTMGPIALAEMDPPAGTFTNSVAVSLYSVVPNATIYYTLDNTPPTSASAVYTTPITLAATAELRVIVYVNGTPVSSEYQGNYQVVPPPPPPPVVTAQPQGETLTVGQSLSLSVSASGSGPLTYQWRNTGVAIGAATNTNYVVASAQLSDAGNYDVIVSNGAGSVTSAVATVTVQLGFNDGIPDSWRVKYFGPNCSTNPQAAATADPDGDGLNNYQEYLMGTDPTNANSVRSVPVAVSTYAGSTVGGQDGSYTNATFDTPGGMTLAPDGRLWLTEIGTTGNRIRIIDQSGLVTTLAGTNHAGYADGLGAAAQFNYATSIAVSSAEPMGAMWLW